MVGAKTPIRQKKIRPGIYFIFRKGNMNLTDINREMNANPETTDFSESMINIRRTQKRDMMLNLTTVRW